MDGQIVSMVVGSAAEEEETRLCIKCGTMNPLADYSWKQWQNGKTRKCVRCIRPTQSKGKFAQQSKAEERVFAALPQLAAAWVEQFRVADPGCFLPTATILKMFMQHALGDRFEEFAERCTKPATRAVQKNLKKKFGATLIKLHKKDRGEEVSWYGLTADGLDGLVVQPMEDESMEQDRVKRQKSAELRKHPTEHRLEEEAQAALPGGVSSKYTTELLGLACAPALLRLKLYPDAKEMTESFAVFAAVRSHLRDDFAPNDREVTVVCVGDGVTPRTAALFAFRTKWQCIAVDPIMRVETEDGSWNGVSRLQIRADMIEETAPIKARKLLVVCVHAHVGLQQCLDVMSWESALGIVAMPCCNFYGKLKLPEGEEPIAEFDDSGVVSPHRLIRVYRRKP